jgi:hypothetical protein
MATGTTDRNLAKPEWWDANARGDAAYRSFADEGISLRYTSVDGTVDRVTFWLSFLPPPE